MLMIFLIALSIYLRSNCVHIWFRYQLYLIPTILTEPVQVMVYAACPTTHECAQPNWPNLGCYMIFGLSACYIYYRSVENFCMLQYIYIYIDVCYRLIYTLPYITHNDRCLHYILLNIIPLPSLFMPINSKLIFELFNSLILLPHLNYSWKGSGT